MINSYKKKTIYGLTIVSSAVDFIVEDIKGKKYYRESYTQLFTSLKSLKEYALKQLEIYFNIFEFENGKDENERNLEEFKESVKRFEGICIQDIDSHIAFEFFKQEITI